MESGIIVAETRSATYVPIPSFAHGALESDGSSQGIVEIGKPDVKGNSNEPA